MKSIVAQALNNWISKVKLFPLLAGAVSLAVSAAIVPVVLAQTPNPDMPPGPPPEGPGFHKHNWLNLTAEQEQQMQSIRQAEREQMDSIFTAEQKARLETARANRENPRQVFESLNITDDQKARMRQVHEATRQQIDAILTAEQRQLMQQHMQQRRQGPPPQGN
ncbi:MAG: Spy/CpxP family protein refolding chaperone [Nostocaceae cyanobacterium]|nr:Spy/CpxP family protein refolding chaperone [Nostocaceae cyanobacterium]